MIKKQKAPTNETTDLYVESGMCFDTSRKWII